MQTESLVRPDMLSQFRNKLAHKIRKRLLIGSQQSRPNLFSQAHSAAAIISGNDQAVMAMGWRLSNHLTDAKEMSSFMATLSLTWRGMEE